MFNKGDRVIIKPELHEDDQTWADFGRVIDYQDRGTVERASQFGYLRILWDQLGHSSLTPGTARKVLSIVTGDDALPRHTWDVVSDADVKAGRICDVDLPCLACGIIQTDDNEFEPCRGKRP